MGSFRTIYRITTDVNQDSKEIHIVFGDGRWRIDGMMVEGML